MVLRRDVVLRRDAVLRRDVVRFSSGEWLST